MITSSVALQRVAAPTPRGSARRRRVQVAAARLFFLVNVLACWQFFPGGPTSLIPVNVVGRPTLIWAVFKFYVRDGRLFHAIVATSWLLVLGIAIAAPIGIALAGVTFFPTARWLLRPLITTLYGIPKVGLVSIYVLTLGLGVRSHVLLVIGAVVFIYYYATEQALREMDKNQIAALRLMGAGRMKMARIYIGRSIFPHLFAATRVAIPLALTMEIFGELYIPESHGLGALLLGAGIYAPAAMTVVLVISIGTYAIDTLLATLLVRYARSIGAGVEL